MVLHNKSENHHARIIGKTITRSEAPMDLHHPLLREFPEHREIIRRLRAGDEQFRKMFDEYHQLDESIYRIEEEIDYATDQEIVALKTRRAWLKDTLFHQITHAHAA